MSYVHPAWLEHQRKRFTRPDAYRFAPPGTPEAKMPGWLDPSAKRVRLKEAQEEEARARAAAEQEALEREVEALRAANARVRIELADVKFALALRRIFHKYSPDQPRVPGEIRMAGSGRAGVTVAPDAMIGESCRTLRPTTSGSRARGMRRTRRNDGTPSIWTKRKSQPASAIQSVITLERLMTS